MELTVSWNCGCWSRTGCSNTKVLSSAIALRAPTWTRSQLQLAALTRVRAGDAEDWRRLLLLLTVNSLAAGLQNTG